MHCWPAMLICFVSQIQNLVKFYSCARCFAHFLAALSPPFLAVHVQKRGSKILQFCIFSFFFLICRVCCSITLFQAKDWPQIIACFVGMLSMLCKRRLQKMHVLICFFGCLPCICFSNRFLQTGCSNIPHFCKDLVQTSPCKQPVPSNNPAS